MGAQISIAGRNIGAEYSPYIVAELSGNHNGRLDRAFQIIDMAKKSGADAIKIQTYTPETMTIDCEKDDFQIQGGLWDGFGLYQLYEWAHTPYEWHGPIFEYAEKAGITVFSTPFDESAVDLLEDLNTPSYKIASFEVVDLPLIAYVAKTSKPMIISTGMACLKEIGDAVETALSNGCNQLALLHCISSYPAPVDQSNLRTIADLAERYDTVVGLSDHTLGTTVAIAGVAAGASIIEKHVTLSRQDRGPDSEFSLEPAELQDLCVCANDAWLAMGQAGYDRKPAEESNTKFRRSLYVVKDVLAGQVFTENNMRRIRPGYGLAPKYYDQILRKKASQDISAGTALKWDHIV